MTLSPHHLLTAALALVLAAVPCAAPAQEVVQPLPGTTDADRLADTMRQLAANPQNVDALVRAGELSVAVGDLSGAAALFARAEKVDPRNGRVKAGMASILVRSERPGEALRYFMQAESFGADPRRFAADRALAYDLIGQQDRAQRDYRVALREAPDDDETIRRYALSLGISGKQELALKQLDPLLVKTDRGAWRARAFILAMNNDVPGAEKIATTMMPAGMAQGLQPFFQRLPNLPAADRAFAVHFGEVHATPERIADARMTPSLPVLGPDPTAPVMMAATQPVVVAPADDKKGKRRDRKAKPGRVALAAVTPTPPAAVSVPAQPPVTLAATPTVRVAPATVQRLPTRPPVTVAQASPAPTALSGNPASVSVRGQLPAATVAQMAAIPVTPSTAPVVVRAGTTTIPTPGFSSGITAAPTTATAVGATAAPVVVAQTAPSPATAAVAAAASVPAPATPAPIAVAPVREVAAVTPPPRRAIAGSEDSILARIIAGLSIPASELDVAPAAVARPAPASPAVATLPTDGARVLAEAKAKTERDAAAKIVADRLAAQKLAADKKAADKKAVADKKALAEKKAAAEKKAIADKEAAEEKRIARANPPRSWVQVAGGATEGDLAKAWKAVKAKAPAVFGSRGGWTTPLRATNRVLAGPFKTDAEARTFVNQLAKAGVSAFTFSSDAGQVVTKLPSK